MLQLSRRRLLSASPSAAAVAVLARSGVSSARASAPTGTWDLTALYASDAAWTTARQKVLKSIEALAGLAGTLGTSAKSLETALQAISDVNRQIGRLVVYATLSADADTRIAANQERRQLATRLTTAMASATAWLKPEILKLGAAAIAEFEADDPALATFGFQLDDILRFAAHTLGQEAELVLAASGDALSGARAIRTQIVASDMPRPDVRLSTGRVRLDDQAFEAARTAARREDRRAAFEAFFGAYKTFESSLGAALASHIEGQVFRARARRFASSRQSALFTYNIPDVVYTTLIAETTAALPSLHRYFRLRRALLGLPDLHYYDLYPPLVKADRRFSLDETRKLVLAAVQPLGPDYVEALSLATRARWMDAYPRPGKVSGAYMEPGAYDVHPYLLLNHIDDYESLTTFAHEWGHAMHALLAKQAQPYETSGYAIFTSEIASTNNEQLLAQYMYDNATSDAERIFYLNALLELFRGTYFRQVMFAEFEAEINAMTEKGEGLSGETLTAKYLALLRKYHGDAVVIDPLYGIEWAYVETFYRNFYVYQYATSLAASAWFSDRLLSGDRASRENYLGVLRAGNSDYPVSILKRAGLDMASPAPYRALIAKFDRTLDRLEALVAKGAAKVGGR